VGHRETETKISVRMWSSSTSLRAIGTLSDHVHILYEKGETMIAPTGKRLSPATSNSLSTGDVVIANTGEVSGEIASRAGWLESQPTITKLIDRNEIEVVIWAAIFGDEGAVRIEDLGIDRSLFGRRIGLVVENYTDFSVGGNPRKLVIESASK
jgi:hypothetical protein